jgi:PPOX class probable F420-dependent enzyme
MEAWQERLLAEERSGVLGTIARGGLPQLVPVCFALAGGEVAIAIDEKPKQGVTLARVRNIERDPRATLLVDHYEERWERLAWLRLEGDADLLERGSEWPEALEALRRRYPRYRAMALESLPLIRLRPVRAVGWRWHDGQAREQQT